MTWILFILPALGGTLSAWHGGQIKGGSNKTLKNFLWALPFLICALVFLPFSLINFLCMGNMLKATGHGRGFRLKEPMKIGAEREKVEYLIWYLEGRIPLYWYKVLIMCLAGLAAVLCSAIVFGLYNPLAGAIIALGGLLKGLNAIIFDLNTVSREYADGVTAYSGLLMAVFIIFYDISLF